MTKLDLTGGAECKDTCIIHKGKNLKLDAEFVANQNTKHINVHLTAKVDGLEIPVPGVERDGCHYVKCPLVKGEKYTFNYS